MYIHAIRYYCYHNIFLFSVIRSAILLIIIFITRCRPHHAQHLTIEDIEGRNKNDLDKIERDYGGKLELLTSRQMELLTKGGSNNAKELAALTATMLSLSSVRAREIQQLDTKYATLLTNKREANRRHVRNERKKKSQQYAVGKLAARVAGGLSNASSSSSSSSSRSSSRSPSPHASLNPTPKKKRARAAVNEFAAQVKKQASVEEASVQLDPASVRNSDNGISPSAALSSLRDF
jgi:hypothetical protein